LIPRISPIERRKTRRIHVGAVPVGGEAPISVQTMTITLPTDVEATLAQIRRAEAAGVDIVRVSCPDEDSTKALAAIVKGASVPVVADIHFHYKRAIEAAEAGAACLRINPGNIGSAERVREVVRAAKDHGCSMRIGVNAGSLDRDLLEKYGEPCPEAMVESALSHARILEDNDFFEIKISVKASDVFLAVAAYEGLAAACDYPLHLGITEAGSFRTGTVKSALGLGLLLRQGIGDTIRVSLSADVVEEVRVGFDILKSLDLRHRGVRIVSCPSCGPPGIRRRQGGGGTGMPSGAYRRAGHPVGAGMRRQRPRRGAPQRYRLDRRRQKHAQGVPGGGAGPCRRHRGDRRSSGRSGGKTRRRHEGLIVQGKESGVSTLQPVRGTHDLLPEEMRAFRHVVETGRDVAARYGFAEMAPPIFEFSGVFARTLGDTSDIVTKEMYTFADRKGESITLRPEGTAGIARAFISNGLANDLPFKAFYSGPMFRYERPQKGRQRQFHQIGVELLGVPEPQADVEVIAAGRHILDLLGLKGDVTLEINTLGGADSRAASRAALVAYLSGHLADLSADSRDRLDRNPLRILDSKDEGDRALVAHAPLLGDFLNAGSRAFYDDLKNGLMDLGLDFVENPRLVRGLDYYGHTAFEFTTDALGAQGTVMAGGRYDGLIKTMGGPAMPGVGWAAGVERLSMLLAEAPEGARPVAMIPAGNDPVIKREATILTERLRRAGFAVDLGFSGNMGKRMKRANKVAARVAVILGEDERLARAVTLRDLDSGEQTTVAVDRMEETLRQMLSGAEDAFGGI
jgi:histidyl-tRNA synthetase